jgi:putative oxidoreductase
MRNRSMPCVVYVSMDVGRLREGWVIYLRSVAFIASGMMAAAYCMAHYPSSFWPILNDGEPAVLFCFIFLYMASVGSGVWSIDRAFGKS